jgi:hypothetical protein
MCFKYLNHRPIIHAIADVTLENFSEKQILPPTVHDASKSGAVRRRSIAYPVSIAESRITMRLDKMPDLRERCGFFLRTRAATSIQPSVKTKARRICGFAFRPAGQSKR